MTNSNNTAQSPSPEYLRFATAISNAIAANRELMREFDEDCREYAFFVEIDDFLNNLFLSVADVKELVHVSFYVDEFKKENGIG